MPPKKAGALLANPISNYYFPPTLSFQGSRFLGELSQPRRAMGAGWCLDKAGAQVCQAVTNLQNKPLNKANLSAPSLQ